MEIMTILEFLMLKIQVANGIFYFFKLLAPKPRRFCSYPLMKIVSVY